MRWFKSVVFYASIVVTDFRRKESCMAVRHFQEQRMYAGEKVLPPEWYDRLMDKPMQYALYWYEERYGI